MSDSSCGKKLVAGFNQFSKLVRRGKAVKVYLAKDADIFFINGVRAELSGNNTVELNTEYTCDRLAELAGVEVPTAVLTEVRE